MSEPATAECTCNDCPHCGRDDCYIACSPAWVLTCGNTGRPVGDCSIHEAANPDHAGMTEGESTDG